VQEFQRDNPDKRDRDSRGSSSLLKSLESNAQVPHLFAESIVHNHVTEAPHDYKVFLVGSPHVSQFKHCNLPL